MNERAGTIEYSQSGVEGIDKIEHLWRKLRLHHKERAPEILKNSFDELTFATRKQLLLDKVAHGHILIQFATESHTGKAIGYCVSTISSKNEAELESIYIEKEYRKQHIGDKFMKTALVWMDSFNVKRKVIGVGVGNEEVFGFYRKYGFYPRMHILWQVDTK